MMAQSLRFYTSSEHEPFLWRAGERAALLVHGFPGSPREVKPIAVALHEAGWTVQALLLPGFARDFARLGAAMAEEWAGAVHDAFMSLRRDYAQTVIVGNSMGSALALHVAALDPPSVDGLILFAPFWRISSSLLDAIAPLLAALIPDLRPFAHADFQAPDVRESVASFLEDANLDDPGVLEQVRRLTLPSHALAQVRRAGQWGMAAAPVVSSPVLICQGARDVLATPRMTRRLAARIPGLVGYVEVDSDHELAHMRSARERSLLPLVQRFAETISDGAWVRRGHGASQ